jgi:hypothetical protein
MEKLVKLLFQSLLKVVVEGMGTCLVFLCRILRIPGTQENFSPNMARGL